MAEQNTMENSNNRRNLRFLIFSLLIVLQIHSGTLMYSLQSLQYNYIYIIIHSSLFQGQKSIKYKMN